MGDSQEYQIKTAWSGEEGILLAEQTNPVLIFIDINLLRMNGSETHKQLKNNMALKATKIIALTAYGLPEQINKALAADFEQ